MQLVLCLQSTVLQRHKCIKDSNMNPNCKVVMEGTFLYDDMVECDLQIVFSPTRFGSGDYEDPPEIRDDSQRDTFYLRFGSTTDRGLFNAGGCGAPSLE